MNGVLAAGQNVFEGFIGCVTEVNRVVWKNQEYWFYHSTTAGVVAFLADKHFRFSSSMLIDSSPFLTGGLAFTAFQIGFHLPTWFEIVERSEMEDFLCLFSGLGTTATFAYLASVPIVTTVAFAILGWVISKGIDWLRKFQVFESVFQWVMDSFNTISFGARGGLLYAALQRGIQCIRPVTTMEWKKAMNVGITNFAIIVCVFAIFDNIASLFIDKKDKDAHSIVFAASFAVGVGVSCLCSANIITTIAMTVLTLLPLI